MMGSKVEVRMNSYWIYSTLLILFYDSTMVSE